MPVELRKLSEQIFIIDNFWSETRCETFIEWAEEKGFEEAKIHIGFGKQVMNKGVRNNERIIFDDEELAIHLWEELEPFVPKETMLGYAIGLNERFRLYKYLPGMRFKRHKDGSFVRNIDEWSSYTFMIYLNEVEEGGSTWFYDHSIAPRTGRAVIFKHELMHEGMEVLQGVKYVLRTDIMYRRLGR